MKVITELSSIADFEAWSGAVDRLEWIIDHGYTEYFDQIIVDRSVLRLG